MSGYEGVSVSSRDACACSVGVPYPVGATATAAGVNFCVYSRGATSITMLARALSAFPIRWAQPRPLRE